MEEREEGEISDGNEDSFGVSYKPVVRPDSSLYRPVGRHVPSSDEEYSTDSDSDSPFAAKRKRPNVSKMDTGGPESRGPHALTEDSGGTQEGRPIAKARRRNNIWSTVMEEQVLAQEIGGFGLKRRLDRGDRSVESYDYLQARKLHHPQDRHYSEDDSHSEEEEEDIETKNKRMSRKRNVKERLSHRKPKTKSGKRELIDVDVSDSMPDKDVGLAIADGLMERKPELIVNVVEVLGREKALDLYKKTQEVERDGGMMVLNGSRRRTSGGVYLQLLKCLPTLEQADFLKIFPQEDSGSLQQWRKRKRAHRKRERHESKPQGETVSEEGLHLGELFSDDPGGAKCPGSTPVTSPQPSDTEDQELSGSLINQLSPSKGQDITPSSPSKPSQTTADSCKTPDHPLDSYNGGFLNIEANPEEISKGGERRSQSAEIAYDDDFLNIHGNEEMELF